VNTIKDQQDALRKILSKYDSATQKLYFDILKLYSDIGSQAPKTTMRREIMAIVKEVVK